MRRGKCQRNSLTDGVTVHENGPPAFISSGSTDDHESGIRDPGSASAQRSRILMTSRRSTSRQSLMGTVHVF